MAHGRLYVAIVHFDVKIRRYTANRGLEKVDQPVPRLGQLRQRPVELLLGDVERVEVFGFTPVFVIFPSSGGECGHDIAELVGVGEVHAEKSPEENWLSRCPAAAIVDRREWQQRS